MKLLTAAIQMDAAPGAVAENRDRADAALRRAAGAGAELLVLPEMHNTGYATCADYGGIAEDEHGPTLRMLRERSRRWGAWIAAGFVEYVSGHLYNSLAFIQPDGRLDIYRKRHLVFWECSRFRRGRESVVVSTPFGRVGFAICADMIYRKVWREYQGRIDLAIIASAWPDFRDRETGRPHWMYGRLGPLAGEIPGMVARELDIPVVFANQSGETTTTVPVLQRIRDRFAGRSAVVDGRRSVGTRAEAEATTVMGEVTLATNRGDATCPSTSVSGLTAGSSTLAA